MNFPRRPKKEWRKKVFSDLEISEIKLLYAKTKNIRLTARTLNVSRTSVKYHCFPNWREEKNQNQYKRKKDLYHSDPEFRKRAIERASKDSIIRRKTDPLAMEYHLKRQRQLYAERPEVRKRISEANRRTYLKRKSKNETTQTQ